MRNVVLIGFMGAGKTTVAQALAALLGFGAVDTDVLVERDAGTTIADIFAREGEPAFRAREASAIASVTAGDGKVIACGGGAILSIKNLAALQEAGPIVYLRAAPATLIERLGDSKGGARPLLKGAPQDVVPALLKEREAEYRAAADVIVDTDGKDPAEIAQEIATALRGAVR